VERCVRRPRLARTRDGSDTELVTRSDRFILGGLGLSVVLAALNGLRSADAHSATQARDRAATQHAVSAGDATVSTPTSDASARAASSASVAKSAQSGDSAHAAQSTSANSAQSDVDAFVALFRKLRQNDTSVVPKMGELAERLCRVHDRCEALDLVRYYSALTPEQRTAGADDEARFFGIRERIVNAQTRPLEDWRELRAAAMRELDDLVRPPSFEGDAVPSARALSLSALLEVEWVERDPELAADMRDELIADADDKATRAIVLFHRAGMLTPQLEPKWLLGRLETVRENPEAARRIFTECLALAHHVNNPDFAEHAVESLIVLAQQAGDLDEVGRLVNEIASFRSPSESWVLARAQAEVLLQRDQAQLAADWLAQHEPSTKKSRAEWELLFGSALLRSGSPNAAREHYESDVSSSTSSDSRLALASLQLKQGDLDAAESAAKSVASSTGLSARVRMKAHALRGEALLRLDRLPEAIPSLLAALELASHAQVRLEAGHRADEAAISVVGEGVGLHALALLAEAYARSDEPLKAACAIENFQTSELHFGLASSRGTWKSDRDTIDMQDGDIVEWSRAFELGLITWVIGADSSVVAYVSPDGGATALSIRRGRKAIEQAVRRVREATLANDDAQLARVLLEVRTELVPDEILRRIGSLHGGKNARLLYLLHGPLERLPVELFAMLDRTPLASSIPVVLPGLPERALIGPRIAPRELTWTILGNPIDVSGATLLPGAIHEIAEIAKLHPEAVRSVGQDFTRAAVLRALSGTTAVHCATHLHSGCGEDKGRLADVGLELSFGESFCAREILEAKPALPLVVLDACDTSGGRFVDSEGLQGISRAFLESGTRNLIVTLWPVKDSVAQQFAIELHRALADGSSPSVACAAARDALRTFGATPADWAAFRAIARE